VGFKAPLELKVCALWGKARTGVWWWGTRAVGPAQVPHRNLWLVRKPLVQGELSDLDGWEVIHNHPGGNQGWEAAVKVFQRHMREMAMFTETLACALGTPFLRADFFVGNARWGVRLNEVAYGCGLEYRNMHPDTGRVVDDKLAMAEIIRRGMQKCSVRLPPQHFLHHLGVHGTEYDDTSVQTLPSPLYHFAPVAHPDDLAEYATEENLCKSMKQLPPYDEVSKVIKPQLAIPMKPPLGHIPTLMMPGVVPGGAVFVAAGDQKAHMVPLSTASLKAQGCAHMLAAPQRPPVLLRA